MLLREVHQNREHDHRDRDRGNARGEVGEERAFLDRLGFCDSVDSTGIKSTGKGFARRDGLSLQMPHNGLVAGAAIHQFDREEERATSLDASGSMPLA